MVGYRKKVSYLEYLENGMKVKNAGFVRIEENDGRIRLLVQVKNIPEQFSGQYELKANGGGTVGAIQLSRGSGGSCTDWEREQPKGKTAVLADGLYIRLPGRRLIQTVWEEPWELPVELPEEEAGPQRQKAPVQVPEECREEEKPAEAPKEPGQGQSAPDGKDDGDSEDSGGREEGSGDGQAMAVNPVWRVEMEPEMTIDSRQEEPVCYGDKWEQLCHMYPQIHPFGDERGYLSIAPRDFVVLRQEYQKMVHNSFLLHGYYNYKHLILGKIPAAGTWRYYLGVPGNFYRREKMVAEMFGFEAFEGRKEPVEAGDFGYFMKQVEI